MTTVPGVQLTGFCNWLDMAGLWGELPIEKTHGGMFSLCGLLDNHLICFNLWSEVGEGCRSRGAGLALQTHLRGDRPLELCSACEQTGGLRND